MEGEIISKAKNNVFLTGSSLSLGHLKIYLAMKFASTRQAGAKAGLSNVRTRQLLCGKYLPKKAETIERLSRAWDIHPIKLTQLFERYRQEDEKNDK